MSFKFTSSAVYGCVKKVQVSCRAAAGEGAFFTYLFFPLSERSSNRSAQSECPSLAKCPLLSHLSAVEVVHKITQWYNNNSNKKKKAKIHLFFDKIFSWTPTLFGARLSGRKPVINS